MGDRKSNYSEKLKDPRWQKRRLQILERDGWKCQVCGSTDKTLHVHHRLYQFRTEPWDYDEYLLVTLCEDCHRNEPKRLGESKESLLRAIEESGFTANEIGWLEHLVNVCAMRGDQTLLFRMVKLCEDPEFVEAENAKADC